MTKRHIPKGIEGFSVNLEMVQQLCTEFQTMIERVYHAGRLSKTEAMSRLGVNEHTMFNRKRKDIRLRTLYELCAIGLSACCMKFNISKLLELIAYCCENGQELVISVRKPDEPLKDDEVSILTRQKK